MALKWTRLIRKKTSAPSQFSFWKTSLRKAFAGCLSTVHYIVHICIYIYDIIWLYIYIYMCTVMYSNVQYIYIYCCVGIFIMIIFIISFIISTLLPANEGKAREVSTTQINNPKSKPWWVFWPPTPNIQGGHVRVKTPPKFTPTPQVHSQADLR